MRFIDLVDKNAVSVIDLRTTYNRVSRYMLRQATILNVQPMDINIEDEIDERVIDYYRAKGEQI